MFVILYLWTLRGHLNSVVFKGGLLPPSFE